MIPNPLHEKLIAEFKSYFYVSPENKTLTPISVEEFAKYISTAFLQIEQATEEKYPEIVICSAVRAKDGKVHRGHRHGHALYAPYGLQGMKGYKDERPYGENQGFITSRNRYVDRFEAMKLQLKAGIKSADPEGYRLRDELMSEDLY